VSKSFLFAMQQTCQDGQDGMAANGFHAVVREHNDIEDDSQQAESNDDEAQYDDCFYDIHGLRSYTVLQHWNTSIG